jgi:hypothetical protein
MGDLERRGVSGPPSVARDPGADERSSADPARVVEGTSLPAAGLRSEVAAETSER